MHFVGNFPTSVHGMLGVRDFLLVVLIYMLVFHLASLFGRGLPSYDTISYWVFESAYSFCRP